jgi:hypothetical protein
MRRILDARAGGRAGGARRPEEPSTSGAVVGKQEVIFLLFASHPRGRGAAVVFRRRGFLFRDQSRCPIFWRKTTHLMSTEGDGVFRITLSACFSALATLVREILYALAS